MQSREIERVGERESKCASEWNPKSTASPAIAIVLERFGMKTRFIAVGCALPFALRPGCVWAAFRRIRFDLYPYRCSYILAFRRHLKPIRYVASPVVVFFLFK